MKSQATLLVTAAEAFAVAALRGDAASRAGGFGKPARGQRASALSERTRAADGRLDVCVPTIHDSSRETLRGLAKLPRPGGDGRLRRAGLARQPPWGCCSPCTRRGRSFTGGRPPRGSRSPTRFFYLVTGAAVWTAWSASRRSSGSPRLRRAWRLFALGLFAQLAGQVAFQVYGLLGEKPYPSIADATLSVLLPVDACRAACIAGGEGSTRRPPAARGGSRRRRDRRVGGSRLSRPGPDGRREQRERPAGRVLGRISGRRHGAAGRPGFRAHAGVGGVRAVGAAIARCRRRPVRTG